MVKTIDYKGLLVVFVFSILFYFLYKSNPISRVYFSDPYYTDSIYTSPEGYPIPLSDVEKNYPYLLDQKK